MRASATPCETCGHRADYHHQFEPMACGRGECSCGQLETKSLRMYRACRIQRREDGVLVIPIAALRARSGHMSAAKEAESLFPEGVPVTQVAFDQLAKAFPSEWGVSQLWYRPFWAGVLPAAFEPLFAEEVVRARKLHQARIVRSERVLAGHVFPAFLQALEASMEAGR